MLDEKHREGKLADDELSNTKKFASGITSVVGTSYVYEQTLSKIKYVKSAN